MQKVAPAIIGLHNNETKSAPFHNTHTFHSKIHYPSRYFDIIFLLGFFCIITIFICFYNINRNHYKSIVLASFLIIIYAQNNDYIFYIVALSHNINGLFSINCYNYSFSICVYLASLQHLNALIYACSYGYMLQPCTSLLLMYGAAYAGLNDPSVNQIFCLFASRFSRPFDA